MKAVLTMEEDHFEEILEYFMDSDSEGEFEGFTAEDIRAVGPGDGGDVSDSDSYTSSETSVRVPDGYCHGWLIDISEMVGPADVPDGLQEADYVSLVFTEDAVEMLAQQTIGNGHAEQVRTKTPDCKRTRKWRPVMFRPIPQPHRLQS